MDADEYISYLMGTAVNAEDETATVEAEPRLYGQLEQNLYNQSTSGVISSDQTGYWDYRPTDIIGTARQQPSVPVTQNVADLDTSQLAQFALPGFSEPTVHVNSGSSLQEGLTDQGVTFNSTDHAAEEAQMIARSFRIPGPLNTNVNLQAAPSSVDMTLLPPGGDQLGEQSQLTPICYRWNDPALVINGPSPYYMQEMTDQTAQFAQPNDLIFPLSQQWASFASPQQTIPRARRGRRGTARGFTQRGRGRGTQPYRGQGRCTVPVVTPSKNVLPDKDYHAESRMYYLQYLEDLEKKKNSQEKSQYKQRENNYGAQYKERENYHDTWPQNNVFAERDFHVESRQYHAQYLEDLKKKQAARGKRQYNKRGTVRKMTCTKKAPRKKLQKDVPVVEIDGDGMDGMQIMLVSFECGMCDAVFDDDGMLKIHMAKHQNYLSGLHGGVNTESSGNSDQQSSNDLTVGGNGSTVVSDDVLNGTVTSDVADIAGKQVPSNTISCEAETSSVLTETYLCAYCASIFSTDDDLTEHLAIHNISADTSADNSKAGTSAVSSEASTSAVNSDAGTSAVNSDAGTSAVNSEASTSAVNSDAGTSAVNSEASTSAVNSEASTSAVSSEASTSAVNSEASTSAVNSEASTSAVNSEASTSAVNSEASTSAVNSEASTSVIAGHKTTEPDTVDIETIDELTEPHLCPYCASIFPSEDDLTAHLDIHRQESLSYSRTKEINHRESRWYWRLSNITKMKKQLKGNTGRLSQNAVRQSRVNARIMDILAKAVEEMAAEDIVADDDGNVVSLQDLGQIVSGKRITGRGRNTGSLSGQARGPEGDTDGRQHQDKDRDMSYFGDDGIEIENDYIDIEGNDSDIEIIEEPLPDVIELDGSDLEGAEASGVNQMNEARNYETVSVEEENTPHHDLEIVPQEQNDSNLPDIVKTHSFNEGTEEIASRRQKVVNLIIPGKNNSKVGRGCGSKKGEVSSSRRVVKFNIPGRTNSNGDVGKENSSEGGGEDAIDNRQKIGKATAVNGKRSSIVGQHPSYGILKKRKLNCNIECSIDLVLKYNLKEPKIVIRRLTSEEIALVQSHSSTSKKIAFVQSCPSSASKGHAVGQSRSPLPCEDTNTRNGGSENNAVDSVDGQSFPPLSCGSTDIPDGGRENNDIDSVDGNLAKDNLKCNWDIDHTIYSSWSKYSLVGLKKNLHPRLQLCNGKHQCVNKTTNDNTVLLEKHKIVDSEVKLQRDTIQKPVTSELKINSEQKLNDANLLKSYGISKSEVAIEKLKNSKHGNEKMIAGDIEKAKLRISKNGDNSCSPLRTKNSGNDDGDDDDNDDDDDDKDAVVKTRSSVFLWRANNTRSKTRDFENKMQLSRGVNRCEAKVNLEKKHSAGGRSSFQRTLRTKWEKNRGSEMRSKVRSKINNVNHTQQCNRPIELAKKLNPKCKFANSKLAKKMKPESKNEGAKNKFKDIKLQVTKLVCKNKKHIKQELQLKLKNNQKAVCRKLKAVSKGKKKFNIKKENWIDLPKQNRTKKKDLIKSTQKNKFKGCTSNKIKQTQNKHCTTFAKQLKSLVNANKYSNFLEENCCLQVHLPYLTVSDIAKHVKQEVEDTECHHAASSKGDAPKLSNYLKNKYSDILKNTQRLRLKITRLTEVDIAKYTMHDSESSQLASSRSVEGSCDDGIQEAVRDTLDQLVDKSCAIVESSKCNSANSGGQERQLSSPVGDKVCDDRDMIAKSVDCSGCTRLKTSDGSSNCERLESADKSSNCARLEATDKSSNFCEMLPPSDNDDPEEMCSDSENGSTNNVLMRLNEQTAESECDDDGEEMVELVVYAINYKGDETSSNNENEQKMDVPVCVAGP